MNTTTELLEDINDLLARLEDFTHGQDGDDITKMRYRIEEVLYTPTSSQTEISDEEIEQAAKDYHRNNGVYYGQVKAFIDAIKWYREQLKSNI